MPTSPSSTPSKTRGCLHIEEDVAERPGPALATRLRPELRASGYFPNADVVAKGMGLAVGCRLESLIFRRFGKKAMPALEEGH